MTPRTVSPAAALFAVLLACLPVAAQAEEESSDRHAALIKTDTIIVEPFGQTMPVIGRLVSRQSGPVAARIAGAVARLTVEVGDRVNEGDVLAELVADRLQWEQRQKEAAFKRAEAELGIRRNELERLRRLRNSAAFQQSRFDDKRLEVATLESTMAEAEAALGLANLNLDYATIRAPYTGTVTLRHTEAGAFVNVGASVITLVNDTSLEVEADIPSDRIGALTPGRSVMIETSGRTVPTQVRALIPEENPLTRTRAVRLSVDPAATAGLTPNQSALVQVPIGDRSDVVTVHKDAVINQLGDTIVFVVTNGEVERRRVTLGDPIGNRMVVNTGLSRGEIVAVRGNERLRDGQAVRVDNGA